MMERIHIKTVTDHDIVAASRLHVGRPGYEYAQKCEPYGGEPRHTETAHA